MSALRPRTARISGLLVTTTAVAAGLVPAGSAQAVSGPEAAAGQHTSVVKLNIGDEATGRGCTGSLIDASWVLTAASCFAATPGTTVPAGAPALKATVTLGDGKRVEVAELAPRADRDVVLARLTTPAAGPAGLKQANVAPAAGADLTAVGVGRTSTEWAPGKAHTGAFTLNASDATTLTITGKGTDAVCKGDTGGPLLNAAGELVGINSRSWQGGCLATDPTETRTGAIAARTDGLREWIDGVRATTPGWQTKALVQSGTSLYQAARLSDGSWTGYTDVQNKASNLGGIRSSAAAGINGDTHVLAISNAGGLFHTVRKADGTWGSFGNVFSVANALGNLTQVSTVSIGHDLHVVAVADGKAFHTVRNGAGNWTPFFQINGSLTNVTAAATASVRGELQVGLISGGKPYHNIRQTNGNWLGWGNVTQAVGPTGPVTSISMAGAGDETHFVIATDNGTRQYHTIRNFNGTWATWGDLQGVLGAVTAKSVSAATVNGEVQVAVTTTDGKLLHTTRHTNRTWDALVTAPLEGMPAAPGALAITATYTG
ncbi:S1 family peptidase [Streptomyces sp. NBC_00335]|uniref:trypsin-like serine protease n=1 Tax=unclassified Streptomyces TaxID=2593676 RepID=UPI002250C45B|nr:MULTISPECIES: trypsin-like serine protease [unclassified Streptomyces]MCX5403850.1 S1 family peptidase [Streptomyces sp. NBC_00086]